MPPSRVLAGGIRAALLRGGTSKGLFFHAADLPQAGEARDRLLSSIMGSPDAYKMQLNGMGGGIASTSKVAIVSPSARPGFDVDYLFGQVEIAGSRVDWTGSCGNLAAAVGLFARVEGLAQHQCVHVWQVNRGYSMDVIVHEEAESVAIPGVPGRGSPIDVQFGDLTSGINIFPTANVVDHLTLPDGRLIEATLINAANPTVMVWAADLGLTGTEIPAQLSYSDLEPTLEHLRAQAGKVMGLTADNDALRVAWVAAAADYVTTTGSRIKKEEYRVTGRITSPGRIHHAFTGTGAINLIAAATVPGTIPYQAAHSRSSSDEGDAEPMARTSTLLLGHPGGVMQLQAVLRKNESKDGGKHDWAVTSAGFTRTARYLMRGETFPADPLYSCGSISMKRGRSLAALDDIIAEIGIWPQGRAKEREGRDVSNSWGALSRTAVFASMEGADNEEMSVEFRVGRSDRTLTLCWVGHDGTLHHFYRLNQGSRHAECTQTSHAFVIFDAGEGAVQPVHANDIPTACLLCSFRPHTRPADGLLVQVVVSCEGGESSTRVRCLPQPDDEYRIMVRPPPHCTRELPPPTEDWAIEYVYTCPPLPSCADYDPAEHTFYIWGDVDFDDYSGRKDNRFPISEYKMNQIVPQLMTGNVLAHHEAGTYRPSWEIFPHWVIQAQYYWQDPEGETGEIDVVICTPETGKLSRIAVPRPFPCSQPMLFESWRDFFERAAKSSGTLGALATPALNVEYKGAVDLDALASVCPFAVHHASFPGLNLPKSRRSSTVAAVEGGCSACEGNPEAAVIRANTIECWPCELFAPRLGDCPLLTRVADSDDDRSGPSSRRQVKQLHISECVVGVGEPTLRRR